MPSGPLEPVRDLLVDSLLWAGGILLTITAILAALTRLQAEPPEAATGACSWMAQTRRSAAP